ncbi:D-2-hydroxyacid dehydrogenase [Bacillus horti]|uniref:Phosphoglycerate dehydrogenase-like enzyme n=1 Tax=Caldalkalibacillus horti TaxID=77523 RepID=A0ABT9VW56_9BACI|nr:D-2-hydroxyacid dehydrogenase [Bacillus horti]MDQ0165223.1 phosphoglycerate dehydrogenase-like enzyme [Bacillus horti]
MYIVSTAKLSDKHQANLEREFPSSTFVFYDHMKQVPADVLAQVEVLVTYGEDITPETVEQMPSLKWVQVLSAGLELIPFSELEAKQVVLTNARGIHRIQMSEYTLGMILQLARKGYEFYDQQKKGIWNRSLRVNEIHGATLGILGLGAIGQEIARKAKAFDMKVIGLRRSTDQASLDYVDELIPSEQKSRIFEESDYVVVILPHTSSTEHFISEKELAQMKESAYLINIARGKVVDEKALIQALEQKKIAGAVLDVFDEEPLPEEHPLWNIDNTILTPHVSGRSPMYMTRALDIFTHNLKLYPNKADMINLIPMQRGY